MATWQAVLILLGALIIGSVLGFVTIRLISRRKESERSGYQTDIKNYVNNNSKKPIPPESTSPKPVPPESTSQKPPINATEDKLELMVQERKKSVATAQTENSGILAELISNLAIATTPLNGKLLLFQTKYWDNNHEIIATLHNNYKEELTQAYTDIRLANVIVWLSNDLGHTSPDLEQSYLQLCTKIAGSFRKYNFFSNVRQIIVRVNSLVKVFYPHISLAGMIYILSKVGSKKKE